MVTNKELTVVLIVLGKRIKFLRGVKGITQTALSLGCNMEKATVSKIEAGHSNITMLTLMRLAHGLSVSVEDLVKHNPVPYLAKV